jgi:DNA-binding MarR family transcriptional regulator
VKATRAIDVARRSGQHKQVVGTIVDELEGMGYVRREPDPADRRAKLVVPTAIGLQQRVRINAAMAGIESEIAERLGGERYREFKDAPSSRSPPSCPTRKLLSAP